MDFKKGDKVKFFKSNRNNATSDTTQYVGEIIQISPHRVYLKYRPRKHIIMTWTVLSNIEQLNESA